MVETTQKHPFVVVRDQGPGVERLRRAVVAIGNFDGVHLGHREVIATREGAGRRHRTGRRRC